MSKDIIVNNNINGVPAMVTPAPLPTAADVALTLLTGGAGSMHAAILALDVSLSNAEKAYNELQEATVKLIHRAFAEVSATDQTIANRF